MKEKHIHTPLFMAVPQTCLRYAMGANVKEKHIHTPLFMAVPQTCLRYAMGVNVKENVLSHSIINGSTADQSAVCNGSKYEQKKTVKNEKSRRGASGTV